MRSSLDEIKAHEQARIWADVVFLLVLKCPSGFRCPVWIGGQFSNFTVSLKMIYDPKWQKNRAHAYLPLLTLRTDSQESPANFVKFMVKITPSFKCISQLRSNC